MADIHPFTSAVAGSVAKARKLKEDKKPFSDLIDDAGHQYVDLVMEGGGVLGIALTGYYTYVLEQAGVRFLGVGGTSAGSINALMIAALGTLRGQEREAPGGARRYADGGVHRRRFGRARFLQRHAGKGAHGQAALQSHAGDGQPEGGSRPQPAWKSLVRYYGAPPKEVYFIDGGIMSNFPINLFHEPYKIPVAPTFGAKIGVDRSAPAEIASPKQLMGAIFDAARHTLDYDFIIQNPDYRHLVSMIETGDHHWLNFALSAEDKVDLFRRGAEKAEAFLARFDWKEYKKIRAELAHAFLESRAQLDR